MAIRNSVDHEAIFMKWMNENFIIDRDRSQISSNILPWPNCQMSRSIIINWTRHRHIQGDISHFIALMPYELPLSNKIFYLIIRYLLYFFLFIKYLWSSATIDFLRYHIFDTNFQNNMKVKLFNGIKMSTSG